MTCLGSYLESRSCRSGTTASHTAIGGAAASSGGGSFDIPQPEYPLFLERYIASLDSGESPSLTERPCLYFPLIADIDLAYELGSPQLTDGGDVRLERVHDDTFVMDVASAFAETVSQMSSKPTAAHSVEVLVMQRDGPYIKGHNTVRDGLHVMLPRCVMSRPTQAVVRARSLPKIGRALAKLPGQINSADKSVDACYSEGGVNWQMYGSAKPGRGAYLVTHSMRLVVNQGECVSRQVDTIANPKDWKHWVPALSVRTAGPTLRWPLNSQASDEIDAVEKEWSDRRFASLQMRGGLIDMQTNCEDGTDVLGDSSAAGKEIAKETERGPRHGEVFG